MANDNEFFDKVSNVANDMADTITKTTSDLYQKGKAQVELVKMKSDIRELYIKLGVTCYAVEKGTGDDSQFAEFVERIDELNCKIDEIEAGRAADKEVKEAEKAAAKQAKQAEKSARDAQKAARSGEPIEVKFTGDKCECGENRIGSLPYCAFCGAKF